MPFPFRRPAGRLVCGLSLGLATLAAARAGTPPTDAVPVSCRDTPAFQVASRDRPDEPGTEIVVTPKRPGAPALPCLIRHDAGAFAIGTGEAVTVLALADRFLALDAGSGPDRTLIVYDLASRRKVVDAPYDDARFAASSDAFVYWRVGAPLRGGACLVRYRKLHGLPARAPGHALREMRFSFADGVSHDTGRTDCTVTQGDM